MHPIRNYVVFELPWEQSDKTLSKLPRMRVTFTEFSLKTSIDVPVDHNPQPCATALSLPSVVVQRKTSTLHTGIMQGIIVDISIYT